jgi:hypothetical protein
MRVQIRFAISSFLLLYLEPGHGTVGSLFDFDAVCESPGTVAIFKDALALELEQILRELDFFCLRQRVGIFDPVFVVVESYCQGHRQYFVARRVWFGAKL